jgi:NAD(P)-dependent dehydrogenase (short-subunit alcohol dehydrogenase family)
MTELTRRTLLAGTTAIAAAGAAPSMAGKSAMPDLKGKSVLITGCSSGFGYVGALHYARCGAKVFATMRNLPRQEARDLRAAADAEKLDITILPMDVLSDEQVKKGVAEAERLNRGALDVVINNAGIGLTGPVEFQDLVATKLAFDTNVFGAQRVIRAALPAMRKKKGGLIVNISSQLGRVIVPGGGHYSATKFALEALSEQLAYELAPKGVEVCVIEPGGYPTKVWVNRNRNNLELKKRIDPERAAAYSEMFEHLGKETGAGRSADPLDVPEAIAAIAAMPAGTRPLRRAVHPGPKPQEAINKVAAETQQSWLGRSQYGAWVKAVHD